MITDPIWFWILLLILLILIVLLVWFLRELLRRLQQQGSNPVVVLDQTIRDGCSGTPTAVYVNYAANMTVNVEVNNDLQDSDCGVGFSVKTIPDPGQQPQFVLQNFLLLVAGQVGGARVPLKTKEYIEYVCEQVLEEPEEDEPEEDEQPEEGDEPEENGESGGGGVLDLGPPECVFKIKITSM